MRSCLVLLLSFALLTGAGAAQELRGRLRSASADTLHVEIHRYVAPVAVPRGWVTRLEVSLGPVSAWQGALEGGAWGATIGAAVGAMIGAEIANATDEPFARTVLVRSAAYGVSLGATAAAVRALRPGERWREVPVRGVAIVPRHGAVGLEIAVRR